MQPGTELKPGDIIEFNSRMLGSVLEQWGAVPLRKEITIDDPERVKSSVLAAVDEADIVLVNAGSSAGSEDFTADVISSLGKVLIHGVATKPGKPVILGDWGQARDKLGSVSAYIGLDLFVKPLVFHKMGCVPPEPTMIEAAISRKLVSNLGMEDFVRVKLGKVGEKIIATPISRGAGILMSLVRADGMLRVPRLSEGYNAGERVMVELFRSPREIEETTVIIGSHDIALDVLSNFLRLKYPVATLSSANVGSFGGLSALKQGEAHCSGTPAG